VVAGAPIAQEAPLSRAEVAAAYAELRAGAGAPDWGRLLPVLCAPITGEGEPARLRRMLSLLAMPEIAISPGPDPLAANRALIRAFERVAGRDLSPRDRTHELLAALSAAGIDLETGAATGF
jgi:hypothetical protein